ncbi:DUF4833 domain-containing protein [Archangium violaceum]|nr:DUF4833 domain-containing protein [Archangium violaceum]
MHPKTWMSSVLGLALALLSPAAHASSATPARSTQSVFFIAKSENRNQVHYGIRVDEDCRPLGPKPVHGYWRMLEKGETEMAPLLGIEAPAYGLVDAQQVEHTPEGWRVRVQLQAFSERTIEIDVLRENGRCVTRAWTTVGGVTSQLDHVYVRLAWPFGIERILLIGVDPDGRTVQEVIRH